jgi:hypothetical protein
MLKVQPPSPEMSRQLGIEARMIRDTLQPSLYFWGDTQSAKPTVNASSAQRFLVEEQGQFLIPSSLLFAYAVICMFMDGFNIDLLILAAGPVLSNLILFSVGIHIIKSLGWTKARSKWGLVLVMTLLSFVPYVFALYVILYKGIFSLFISFSLSSAFKTILFVFSGHWMVKKTRMIQEFHGAVYKLVREQTD